MIAHRTGTRRTAVPPDKRFLPGRQVDKLDVTRSHFAELPPSEPSDEPGDVLPIGRLRGRRHTPPRQIPPKRFQGAVIGEPVFHIKKFGPNRDVLTKRRAALVRYTRSV